MSEDVLLQIVRTWKINEKPEYRGFRCANCQRYIQKSWHHWLKTAGFETPVHSCNSCEKKFKLLKIKKNYKTFTCDKCGKKMYKAWHVWTKKDNILSEAHFCKNCGEKLKFGKEIKGIIYDLDGTIISTVKLHEDAWLYAGKKFDIPISDKMLLSQKGISDEAAALMMLPKNKRYLLKKFVEVKQKYTKENIEKITFFPNALKTIRRSLENGYRVGICTSARRYFVKNVLDVGDELKKLQDKIIWVWQEMYKKGKPSPEALNLTIKKMGLNNSEIYYIGDAFSDYKTAMKAKVKFIYFCPNLKKKDKRIPKSISAISSHREIFKLLKCF